MRLLLADNIDYLLVCLLPCRDSPGRHSSDRVSPLPVPVRWHPTGTGTPVSPLSVSHLSYHTDASRRVSQLLTRCRHDPRDCEPSTSVAARRVAKPATAVFAQYREGRNAKAIRRNEISAAVKVIQLSPPTRCWKVSCLATSEL